MTTFSSAVPAPLAQRHPGNDALSSVRPRSRWSRVGGGTLLALLMMVLLASVASLMVGHWYTLPKPDHHDQKLTQALLALSPTDAATDYRTYHVLYADCACSRRVLDHLVSSQRPADLSETLILVGDHPEFEMRARRAQFSVLVLTPQELHARFGLVSAPLLLVMNRSGHLAYVGGYTERKQGFSIRDLEIIESVRAEATVAELPLFGCAVSRGLQDLIDPLGLKYSFEPGNAE